MNNIAEGFERNNNKDYIKFLGYSKGSAGEVRSMLYVATDLGYVSDESFNSLHQLSVNIITQISNFIKYLKTVSLKK